MAEIGEWYTSLLITDGCMNIITSRSAIIMGATLCIGRAMIPVLSQESADLIFAGRMQTLGGSWRERSGSLEVAASFCRLIIS